MKIFSLVYLARWFFYGCYSENRRDKVHKWKEGEFFKYMKMIYMKVYRTFANDSSVIENIRIATFLNGIDNTTLVIIYGSTCSSQ